MRCLSCKYSLSHLAVHRCPECGRAFDPNNSSTFRPSVADLKKKLRRSNRLIVVVVLILTLLHAIFSWYGWRELGSYLDMTPGEWLKESVVIWAWSLCGVPLLYAVNLWRIRRLDR